MLKFQKVTELRAFTVRIRIQVPKNMWIRWIRVRIRIRIRNTVSWDCYLENRTYFSDLKCASASSFS
jgi:hypothetical protein